MSKEKNDIFYQKIEGKLDDLKQGTPEKEEITRAEKINNIFSVSLGVVILIGLLFTLFNILK